MERESFEDVEIARFLNEGFVAIKVDREERPDIDDVYMAAVQMLTGRGGWPMTAVLTPDRKPFFGGTYFPARDGDRGARQGFLTILRELKARYADDPAGVVATAEEITRRVQRASNRLRPSNVPGPDALVRSAQQLSNAFDPEHGGFGRAPKFPRPVTLDFLLRYQRRARDPQALHSVLFTLDKMANGGMYDHVGGGFHRYSTDARWLVPHFEKMLYDNAQLAVTYLEAYQASGEERFADVARDILRYVAREMTAASGAFYSATDADSPTPNGHDEEGWFFTWTPAELEQVLGAERARVVATELGVTEEALREELAGARAVLYAARSKRPPPLLDDKILTSWNGLMVSAFARAALVLDDDDARARAQAAARFLLDHLRDEQGRLARVYNHGVARQRAVLDDYAFFIQGLLDLWDATADVTWLAEAVRLQAELDAGFADEQSGAWFMTARDAEALLTRDKPSYDGAEPSGNAVATLNLLRLAELTGAVHHRQRAERALGTFGAVLSRGGTSAPKMLSALDFYLDTPLEVAIVAPAGQPGSARPLVDVVRRTFVPNHALVVTTEGAPLNAARARVPWVDGKIARSQRATAYVCERGVCELPTSDPAVLSRQLAKAKPLTDGAGAKKPASGP
jgi:uncharacterized protein YyaL (SSP411 family)